MMLFEYKAEKRMDKLMPTILDLILTGSRFCPSQRGNRGYGSSLCFKACGKMTTTSFSLNRDPDKGDVMDLRRLVRIQAGEGDLAKVVGDEVQALEASNLAPSEGVDDGAGDQSHRIRLYRSLHLSSYPARQLLVFVTRNYSDKAIHRIKRSMVTQEVITYSYRWIVTF